MSKEFYQISKDDLVKKLKVIRKRGWVHTGRKKNDGAVGNTLEDLLGIPENNLSIANTVNWELKTQRKKTNSLLTLFHVDPKPRKPLSVVANEILPFYGWDHKEAGKKYPISEKSFRATLNSKNYTDRGFKIFVNSLNKKVEIVFNPLQTNLRHENWKKNVCIHHGITEKSIAYWDFDELIKKCGDKLKNTILVIADSRMNNNQEEFFYEKIIFLEEHSFLNFLNGINNGNIYIDFDARTGHNHGTKFRIRQSLLPVLYSKTILLEG